MGDELGAGGCGERCDERFAGEQDAVCFGGDVGGNRGEAAVEEAREQGVQEGEGIGSCAEKGVCAARGGKDFG